MDLNPPLIALFRRLLAERDQPEGADWDATDSEIDCAVYHDPDIHRREVERVFRRMPLCLGRADQLPEPGTMIARDLLGLPLLIVRDRGGEIRVLLYVCRHRGARLLETQETVSRQASLSCPYHAWTYELDGALRGIPGGEGFPCLQRAERGLRRLPSAVRHGFVWAVLDPQATDIDVSGFLGDIDRDLASLGLEGHHFFRQRVQRRACNWKLVMDAFQEVYHIRRLHSGSIAGYFPGSRFTSGGEGLHTRILVGREPLAQAQDLPESQWDVRCHATLTHAIFPNSLLIYHPDFTSHLGMFPTAPGELLFVHSLFTPHAPRSDKERAHWERSFDLIDGSVFSAEDLHISEQIQSVIGAGANQRFALGRFEQNLRRFHANLAALIAEPLGSGAAPTAPTAAG